jgi:chromosome segregation ATPase
MNRIGKIIFLLLIVLVFAGCATMEDLKTQISTKVTAITSNVDPALVAKVPQDKKGGFPKAEFAVKVAEEKSKLAALKSELAAKQKKLADYEEDIADIELKDFNLDYDIIKQDAVDAAGMGKKEDNIKAMTNLKVKKIDLQKDRLKAEGNMAATKQQMQDLADKIKAQEEKVKGLTSEKAKPEEKAPAAPAEKTK